MTPLQTWWLALQHLLDDARDELDPATWRALLGLLTIRVAAENGRLLDREERPS